MPDEADPIPTSRELPQDEFLFHLYRGSELLQDDHVHEAKRELEQALQLSPRDEKSQDLLGVVYFRLGLYPRAIAIYEDLISHRPKNPTPRVNLALCYLKTGQAALARDALEKVLELEPNHLRAWGYLGLAFQRLGEYDRAGQAFLSGGHEAMAQRLLEWVGDRARDAEPLDRRAGQALEVPAGGQQLLAPSLRPFDIQAADDELKTNGRPELTMPAESARKNLRAEARTIPPTAEAVVGFTVPRPVSSLGKELVLVRPHGHAAVQHPSGWVSLRSDNGVAVRMDALRAMSCPAKLAHHVFMRRKGGHPLDEPFGGLTCGMIEVEQSIELILGPLMGTRLWLLSCSSSPLTVRENALVCMERTVAYECESFVGPDGDTVPMVQLQGSGTLVLALPLGIACCELSPHQQTLFRTNAVYGWTGQLRWIANDLASQIRGFVVLSGEGMVLVDGR